VNIKRVFYETSSVVKLYIDLLASSNTTISIFSLSLQGKVPILSNEAFHQLHIFIFVLAVTHVVMSATTIILGLTQVLHRESLHYKCMIY
jgi:hypothetical protein